MLTPIYFYKTDSLTNLKANSLIALKTTGEAAFSLFITDKNGLPYPLKDEGGTGGITAIQNTDGNLTITGGSNKVINVSTTLLNLINSALQSGDNVSNLINDANYITLADIPTFVASDYDLEDFTNAGVDPYAHLSDLSTGITNLDYIPSPTQGIVTSDTGTDATIPLADGTNAGLLKPTKFTVLENTSGVNTGDQDLSGKANINSPSFTGTPTAPTATLGTNTTQIATTAFVQAEKNLIAHWTKTGDDIRNSNIGTVDIGNSYSAGFSAKTTINGDGYNSAISTKGKINSNIGYGLSDQSSGMFQSSGIVFTSYLGTIKFNPIYTSQTSAGTYNFVGFENQTIAPTSGGRINNMFNLSPIINQTGGANGITRGIYINPTLTSAFDFRAIEVTAGKVIVPVTTETAVQEYADNAAAITAGLAIGTHYRTGDLLKIVH